VTKIERFINRMRIFFDMKKIKNDDYIKLYTIFKTYEYFPNDSNEQRKIVKTFYQVIHCEKGVVDVEDADEGRIYYVANSLWDKAQKKIGGLSDIEKIMLSYLTQIKEKDSKGYLRMYNQTSWMNKKEELKPKINNEIFELEEKITRLLEKNKVEEISSDVNNAAFNVLGYYLNSKIKIP